MLKAPLDCQGIVFRLGVMTAEAQGRRPGNSERRPCSFPATIISMTWGICNGRGPDVMRTPAPDGVGSEVRPVQYRGLTSQPS